MGMGIDDISVIINNLGGGFTNIGASNPNHVIVFTVAQADSSCCFSSRNYSEFCNQQTSVVVNNLDFVTVPAVTVYANCCDCALKQVNEIAKMMNNADKLILLFIKLIIYNLEDWKIGLSLRFFKGI